MYLNIPAEALVHALAGTVLASGSELLEEEGLETVCFACVGWRASSLPASKSHGQY